MVSIKKTAVATAIAASMGVAGVANAAAVQEWLLTDFDGDGLESDFAFYSAPPGNGPNVFTNNGSPIIFGGENAAGSFSDGFNFGGTGIFMPFVGNSAGTGNIAADITAGALTFSALDFGGNFPFPGGTNFFLAPNVLADANDPVTDLGGGNFGVVVTYVSTINDPGGAFHNFAANWRLEGIMCTSAGDAACNPSAIPIPAAAWLFGSGLIGLVGVARRRRKSL